MTLSADDVGAVVDLAGDTDRTASCENAILPVLAALSRLIPCDLVLWTRIDDMRDAAEIRRHFEVVVLQAGLDRDRARDWVVFRSVDYWLWGLEIGLTEDPLRCRRLVSAMQGFSGG